MSVAPTGQALEVLGLAEDAMPGEVEQQLEPLVRLGAQLKWVDPGRRLMACFDSPHAAQQALLSAGALLPFQLQPVAPSSASSSWPRCAQTGLDGKPGSLALL